MHITSLPANSVLLHVCAIHSRRCKSLWVRDAVTRWLYRCARLVADSPAALAQPDDWERLSASPILRKYAAANMEDFLDEFPRLPPEANPLDPRFLIPGAPLVAPAEQRQQVDLERWNRAQPGVDGEEEDALAWEQLAEAHQHPAGRRPAPQQATLGPELPLMQLFLESLMPWNAFDPRFREDDDTDDDA